MFLLQLSGANTTVVLILGTIGMCLLVGGIIFFLVFHQRKTNSLNLTIKQMEIDQQKMMLDASIKMQEEERQRLAADLHDDAGPLLATCRLYLTENLVNQDKASQLQSIYQARQILDDTIQLVRNISHSLMPPTLKNFGLESAINDLCQKITGSGVINASCRFHDYRERLKPEKELVIFRIAQELLNNILKHSGSSFIHFTQNIMNGKFYLRIHHDGRGIVQSDFEKLNKGNVGLGLKNVTSRINLLKGTITFDKDVSQTYYKTTIEIDKDVEF